MAQEKNRIGSSRQTLINPQYAVVTIRYKGTAQKALYITEDERIIGDERNLYHFLRNNGTPDNPIIQLMRLPIDKYYFERGPKVVAVISEDLNRDLIENVRNEGADREKLRYELCLMMLRRHNLLV